MDFDALRVDAHPVDEDLLDAGVVGPELAHLAGIYRGSSRALVWRNPSSDWQLFLLLPPIASRLSLLANPIFAQLTRSWGLNARFIGVDSDGLVYDFRGLLSDQTLRLLVELLGAEVQQQPELLDTLFAALAQQMLTVLPRREADWGKHLDVEHRLEPLVPASLFSRESRYPDLMVSLRQALKDKLIDVELYGRVLRSVELRETSVEQRIGALLESALDPVTMAKLARTGVGKHLGCYNWLRLDLRHAAPRAHVLTRLPGLASFFAEALVPQQAAWLHAISGAQPDEARRDEAPCRNVDDAMQAGRLGATDPRQTRTLDLRALAARNESSHAARWAAVLQRAIDAGQDRLIIEAIAQRFAVDDNLIRRLWRESPEALGQPPTWHLTQILRRLAEGGPRRWPASDDDWQALIAAAIPTEAR